MSSEWALEKKAPAVSRGGVFQAPCPSLVRNIRSNRIFNPSRSGGPASELEGGASAKQVPGGDKGFESGHFDGWIDSGTPEQAAVFVLDLNVCGGIRVRATADGM